MDGCHRTCEISEDFCSNLQKSNCGNKKMFQVLCEIRAGLLIYLCFLWLGEQGTATSRLYSLWAQSLDISRLMLIYTTEGSALLQVRRDFMLLELCLIAVLLCFQTALGVIQGQIQFSFTLMQPEICRDAVVKMSGY